MKGIEKSKAQKIIAKIQNGEFDENDVDNLYMKLRAYSAGNPVFREIADFVAHNDLRNKGITNQALQAMYYSIKYFIEYVSPKRSLDIGEPFPLWIKTLIKYQIRKIDETKLKAEHNVSASRLISRIDSGFKDDKKNKVTKLKDGKLSANTLDAIRYVMSFIISKVAFTQDDLMAQLIKVLDANGLEYDKDYLDAQSNKIALCVILLFHNAEFDIKGHKPGYCKVCPEKASVSHEAKFVDNDGNEVDVDESFGMLQVNGYVVLEKDGKDLTVAHPIMSTKLEADEWCADTLFHIEPVSEEIQDRYCKRLKVDKDLGIDEQFKLMAVGA
jgi:hypothetical protein